MYNIDKYDYDREPFFDLVVFFPISDFLIPYLYFFYFTPNFITLLSTISTFYSIYLYYNNDVYCYLFYFMGYLFDSIDGRMARKYNQTSTFGMIIDLVSDNITNIPLLFVLIQKTIITFYDSIFIGIIKVFLIAILLLFVFIFSVIFGMNEAYDCYIKTKNDNFFTYKKSLIEKTYYNNTLLSYFYLQINKTSYFCYRIFFKENLNNQNKISFRKKLINYREFGPGNLNIFVILIMLLISNL